MYFPHEVYLSNHILYIPSWYQTAGSTIGLPYTIQLTKPVSAIADELNCELE